LRMTSMPVVPFDGLMVVHLNAGGPQLLTLVPGRP
jgi:hypothetical protein